MTPAVHAGEHRHAGRLAALAMAALICAACVAPSARGDETNPFGIATFSLQTTEQGPLAEAPAEPYLFDQAEGHPFAVTSTVQFATEQIATNVSTGDPKNVILDLPPGLIANPSAVERCPTQLEHCPVDSQVGVYLLRFDVGEGQLSVLGEIVNVTPYNGEAAELGLEVPYVGRVLLDGRIVHAAQGYSLAIVGRGLPVLNLSNELSGVGPLHLASLETTLWGTPAAAAHNAQRGLSCLDPSVAARSCTGGGAASGEEAVPFLTMPGSCNGEAPTTVAWSDSWQQPERYARAQSKLAPMTGCERLVFSPEVSVRPDTTRAQAPVGIDLDVKMDQFEGTQLAAPDLREATVTLPAGMAINPAVGAGLGSCDASGPSGIDIPTGTNAAGEELQPGEVGPGEEIPPPDLGPEEPELAPGHCPKESIVGTAEASTPLLAHPIEGRIYLATPECGGAGQSPCTERDAADGSLYRLYVELGAGTNTKRTEGVLIKLAASVQANTATGQLTVRIQESPQVPIGELSLHLFGGERALLANPASCGPAVTTSRLRAWSAPYTPEAAPSSYYKVTGCGDPQPFRPGLLAGSVNADGGSFSPFTMTVSSATGEPYIDALQVHAPPGVSAMLASVTPCPLELASTSRCPPSSRVGDSEVAAGAGTVPLYLPGTVYLTGPYGGAPYGLAIVTDAVAGPLNLGVLTIRARIDIDPQTGALTVTSDPIPRILLGVPLDIQRVTLNLDRPEFALNPTDCAAETVTATVLSTQGESAEVSSPYAAGYCTRLAFKPKLAAQTSGHTSFAGGANLQLSLGLGKASPGNDANLAQIRVALPKQLPTRLTTLQGACPAKTFDTNPAACPSTSVVGGASAQTPVLAGRLSGPVYFVAHGRETFPSPVVVLQGDGVALELGGATTIERAGRASVAFDAIPDVPMETLQLSLPQGTHSLLSANTSLCAQSTTATVERKVMRHEHGHPAHTTVRTQERVPASLSMPVELVAHNGAVVHLAGVVRVSGCAASKRRV
jgi:hypothetical protein